MDITRLEKLFAEGKMDEARTELKAILDTELNNKERGEVLLRFAQLCLEIETRINNQYADAIEEGLGELKAIDKEEVEGDRQAKLAQIRKDALGK